MLSMVGVLPETPLLVPELGAGASAETAKPRSACVDAAGAARLIAMGADVDERRTEPQATGYAPGQDLAAAIATGL